jgi:hypothetical protein
MNIYRPDPCDPFIVSIKEMIAAQNFENIPQAEPFKDNIARGSDHPSWGHRWNHTPEAVEKIRQKMTGEGNHRYGKPSSKKQKEAMSKAMKGIAKSDEQKEKMRQVKLGKIKSSSHKEAMAEAHRQRLAEKVQCPHCNKYCSKNHWATQRHHFDNCKMKG